MTRSSITDLIDPAKNLSVEDWLELLEDIGEDHGYFEPLGPDHSAIFIDDTSQLLVTFETISSVRSRASTYAPLGWELATKNKWSQLCLLSHSDTWFRHRAIYQFFDKLVDDGFFDKFDKVVFYGSGACGYAASAFSVVSPGSTVIVLRPQATLDPRVSEWDRRFEKMRRVSFTDRYGFAPDMKEAADQGYVLYDPEITEDAMHAALFTRPNITKMRCRFVGGEVEAFLRRMDVLEPLIEGAMAGTLTSTDFYRLFRERRNYLPYLRRFLEAVENQQRPFLTALMCRSVLSRMNTPRFRRQLTHALVQLNEVGRSLPETKDLHKV